jgi:ribonuclease HI
VNKESPTPRATQAPTARPAVELYTDGGCSGNPGPGGWAYVLRHVKTGQEREDSGAEPLTTNNRMELMAVIRGLEALKKACRVKLVTDSAYVGKGLTEWMPRWKRNGWRLGGKSGSKPVKNLELWQRLDELMQKHDLHYVPVLGHSGHPENERCDQLAVAAYQKYLR